MRQENGKLQAYGFTLIEILVSITIFSTVVGVITNLTLGAMQAERIIGNNQVALDNARFILQRISRAIRVSVIKTPSSTTSTIDLIHPRRGQVRYFWNADHRIVERIGGDPTTDSYLDSSKVTIENFYFDIKGADDGTDGRQPQVSIILKIKPPKAKDQDLSSIRLETTLSQRCLDNATLCQAY